MARLYEYQSKSLLKAGGLRIPEGRVASSPEEARAATEAIGKPVVLKIQVWATGRAKKGGIQFAETPEDAFQKANLLLGMEVDHFIVEKVLVEERLDIREEYFAGLVIDDEKKIPVLIFSRSGGTGVEETARGDPGSLVRIPVNIRTGLKEYTVRNALLQLGLTGRTLSRISTAMAKFAAVARAYDARSAEMNPLVMTAEGRLYAADSHFTVDDYAVFRHPELGIEVAREFDRPATELEKIAYRVEEKDHRGTFYFFQMTDRICPEKNVIGFNGAGGGGSMMSMDAVLNKGFTLANFCDTSGNPSAAKVYRAAKIILSQPGIQGYFASGSGVASQEQYHSARGLVKAFLEDELDIPAVIRLGGNYERKAIEILHQYCQNIPGRVEGYGRDDSPEFCAGRMKELVHDSKGRAHRVKMSREPELPAKRYAFRTLTGEVAIDHSCCRDCSSKGCVDACAPRILKVEKELPVLAVEPDAAAKGKCTECLACEIFCRFHESGAIHIRLPIPGLKEYRKKLEKNEKLHGRNQ
jgi:succinyl-CoA synthetase beta subunit